MRTILKTLLISLLLSVGSFANATTTTTAVVPAFVCTSDADCSNHGTCNTSSGQCICDSGHIEDDCSYEQDKQVTAFLLHFFFGMPFGAGHFYIGEDALAAGKLALFWGSALFICSFECLLGAIGCVTCFTDKCSCPYDGYKVMGMTMPISAIGVAGLVSSFGWWLADAVKFGKNDIDDSDGKPLEEW